MKINMPSISVVRMTGLQQSASVSGELGEYQHTLWRALELLAWSQCLPSTDVEEMQRALEFHAKLEKNCALQHARDIFEDYHITDIASYNLAKSSIKTMHGNSIRIKRGNTYDEYVVHDSVYFKRTWKKRAINKPEFSYGLLFWHDYQVSAEGSNRLKLMSGNEIHALPKFYKYTQMTKRGLKPTWAALSKKNDGGIADFDTYYEALAIQRDATIANYTRAYEYGIPAVLEVAAKTRQLYCLLDSKERPATHGFYRECGVPFVMDILEYIHAASVSLPDRMYVSKVNTDIFAEVKRTEKFPNLATACAFNALFPMQAIQLAEQLKTVNKEDTK